MRTSLWSIVTALGAFMSAALIPIACTDEGEAISGLGSEGAGTASAAAQAAASGSGGSAAGSGGAGGGAMDGGLPDGALEQCLMEAMGAACSVCACNNCLAELSACEMDMGCVAIRECAQVNMCTGIDCLTPCGTVINMYGGVGGPSASLALALSMCVEGACMAECAPVTDAGGDGG